MKIRRRTIRTLEGLLLSLLFHLLIFLLFFVSFKELKFTPYPAKSKKISLNLKQISTVPPAPKPVLPPKQKAVKPQPPQPKLQPVIPPQPKPVEEKPLKSPAPVAKKKLLDEKARLVVEKKENTENNVTKVAKKEKPKKSVKKEEKKTRKKVVKRSKPHQKYRRPSRPKKGLAGALMGSGRSVSLAPSTPASANYGSEMIKELYGSEFDGFTPTQKKFIKSNLGIIHRITQRTLIQNGYPDIAVRTHQEGTNVVTFYLHPNGDITGLRLKSRIGYTALDENTLQVIRIAYKGYPHPKTKTKITFYVRYSLY